jgi:hypothetical protein
MDRAGLAMVDSPRDLDHQASQLKVIGLSNRMLFHRIGRHRSDSFHLYTRADAVLIADFAGAGMEHLWSLAGETGGDRSQMGKPRQRLKQAESAAGGNPRQPFRSAW